ncbi:conserved hypothetical protein [Xenorhabdus bovienii str. oregonense]|uniref:Inner membrane protein n=1 Tax=Xenorhabdus bovienii str. oregonense TaxID=1398202 RepID=A0A077P2T6_XENBV|nr:conserved hypothetical protein [Xenorhabdus bovienii str. oregonense]
MEDVCSIVFLSFDILFLHFYILLFVFLKLPKYNNSIFKFLTFFGILGFVISLPIYWYGDFKLKQNGYINCYKKSISAPQKYAKNEKLCD